MKKNYLVILVLGFAIFSCDQDRANHDIYWVVSNAICIHWTDFGKKNFDTKAIRIVLRSSNPKVFESKKFYLNTFINEKGCFILGNAQKVKKNKNNYFLFLYLRSEDLYDLFPKGMSKNNDDCYQIELANMIGQGQVVMVDESKEFNISKSRDYIFYVGPQ